MNSGIGKRAKPLLLSMIVAGTAVLAAACPADDSGSSTMPEPAPEPSTLDLTILHLNDTHSHLSAETFDYDVGGIELETTLADGSSLEEVEVAYGGYPAITTLFRDEESAGGALLKLHAGDAITGTPSYSLFKGQADAEVLNRICFDAFTVGNHEFDDGDAGLAAFLDFLNADEGCQTAVLGANVVPAASSALQNGYLEPYAILEREGIMIGVIGIDIAQKTKESSMPDEGTKFLDETATAQDNIDELTAMGVEHIILLTHYQYEREVELAKALTGVDVVVGGDSHTLLGDSTFTDLGFTVGGEYPTQVSNMDGDPVCVVQAWEYTHLLGRLKVSFEDGVVTQCSGSPVMPIGGTLVYKDNDQDETERELEGADRQAVLDALTAEDEIVLAMEDEESARIVARYRSMEDGQLGTVIGAAAEDFCLERVPGEGRSSIAGCRESAYNRGSDITMLVSRTFLDAAGTADAVLLGAGSVRVDLPEGDITFRSVMTILPFESTIVFGQMTGAQIKTVLEQAMNNWIDNGGSTGSYPYSLGLRFNVDASAESGSRISELEINPRIAGQWTDVDPDATYTVATDSFIATGRDGYLEFANVEFQDTQSRYSEPLIRYIERLTAAGEEVQKLPAEVYSTKNYIGRNGCNHGTQTSCEGY